MPQSPTFEKNPEASDGAKSVVQALTCGSRTAPITPLLRELHWWLLCFQAQFKMLIFKAFHGTGP